MASSFQGYGTEQPITVWKKLGQKMVGKQTEKSSVLNVAASLTKLSPVADCDCFSALTLLVG